MDSVTVLSPIQVVASLLVWLGSVFLLVIILHDCMISLFSMLDGMGGVLSEVLLCFGVAALHLPARRVPPVELILGTEAAAASWPFW